METIKVAKFDEKMAKTLIDLGVGLAVAYMILKAVRFSPRLKKRGFKAHTSNSRCPSPEGEPSSVGRKEGSLVKD